MNKLQKLHKEITKENKRIEMMKTTRGLDVDFMRETIKNSKNKIAKLQETFDNEYELIINKQNYVRNNSTN